jgi:hypothetical protein
MIAQNAGSTESERRLVRAYAAKPPLAEETRQRNRNDRMADEMGSINEVECAIKNLTPADLSTLKRCAFLIMLGLAHDCCGRTWEDLLSEAVCRTIEGAFNNGHGRHWNRNVDFIRHLAECMRSICSHWRRNCRCSKAAWQSKSGTNSEEEDSDFVFDDGMPSQSVADENLIIAEILSSLPPDPITKPVFLALWEGETALAIQKKWDLTRTQYENAVNRIVDCLIRLGIIRAVNPKRKR